MGLNNKYNEKPYDFALYTTAIFSFHSRVQAYLVSKML